MKWFKHLFGMAPVQSASLAKERLQVIVAHQRRGDETPDFLPKLQRELTEVIAKYVKIDQDQVVVDFEQQGDRSVLELNITIPELTQPEKLKQSQSA